MRREEYGRADTKPDVLKPVRRGLSAAILFSLRYTEDTEPICKHVLYSIPSPERTRRVDEVCSLIRRIQAEESS